MIVQTCPIRIKVYCRHIARLNSTFHRHPLSAHGYDLCKSYLLPKVGACGGGCRCTALQTMQMGTPEPLTCSLCDECVLFVSSTLFFFHGESTPFETVGEVPIESFFFPQLERPAPTIWGPCMRTQFVLKVSSDWLLNIMFFFLCMNF